MRDDHVEAKVIYGFTRVRHEVFASVADVGRPRHALEAAWWWLARAWRDFLDIVVPSFLFALSITCFMYAFGGLR